VIEPQLHFQEEISESAVSFLCLFELVIEENANRLPTLTNHLLCCLLFLRSAYTPPVGPTRHNLRSFFLLSFRLFSTWQKTNGTLNAIDFSATAVV